MGLVLGVVHGENVTSSFFVSMLRALTTAGLVAAVENEFSGVNISGARNNVCSRFLSDYEDEWLLFVDTDMAFDPGDVAALAASADPETRPIVSGLYVGNDCGQIVQHVYDLGQTVDGECVVVRRVDRLEPGQLLKVGATGAGFLLIHRDVLVGVRDAKFSVAYPWFQETELDDKPCGEDFTFCIRAQQVGYPIYVDTSVRPGHGKVLLIDADMCTPPVLAEGEHCGDPD